MTVIYTQMVLYHPGHWQTKILAIAGNIQLPSIEAEQKQIGCLKSLIPNWPLKLLI